MPLNPTTETRARVTDRYALIPLDAVAAAPIPRWKETQARILAGPVMGAGFVAIHCTVQPGGGVHQPADDRTETFIYFLSGGAELTIEDHRVMAGAGGFAYVPHAADYQLRSPVATSLLLFRKRFEPVAGVAKPEPLTGNLANIPVETWLGNEHTRVQEFLPNDPAYDLEVNLSTFDPGHGLPGIELHAMQHGALILEGNGSCYLGRELHEAQAGDFVWTGPHCPHGFVAGGSTPTKILAYKNANRDVSLERRSDM